LRERAHDLLGAVRCFEEAAALDPDAAPVHKALIPLYVALDRPSDALAASRKTVDLDPGDYETWYILSRQLRSQGNLQEALTALSRARACSGAKDNLEAFVLIAGDLGRLYEETKQYTKAISVLDDLIQLLEKEKPDARPAEIHEQLGQLCARAGKHGRAIVAFEKAQAMLQDQDLLGVRRLDYLLAGEYCAIGKPAEALRKLDAYLLTQPSTTEPYELKVRLLKKLGRAGEVVKVLEEAADRDPNNVALKLFLAQQYIRASDNGAGEQLYIKLAKEAPTPDVYRALFGLYQSEQRMGDALDQLDRAIEAGVDKEKQSGDAGARARARAMITALEDHKDLAEKLLPAAQARLHSQQALQPDTRQFLAVVAARTKRLDLAEELYRSCLQESITPQTEMALYDGLVRVLWAAGKHQAIVDVCRQGLNGDVKDTQRSLFHANLARALVLLGNADEAVAEADEAVQLCDSDDRLRFRLLRVSILETAERLEKAKADCMALLKELNKPDEVRQVRYTLSNVYAAAKQYGKSEEQLRLILQEFPDDATANNDLGYLMADQNRNLEEAERLIRNAVALDEAEKKNNQRMGADDDKPNAAYIDSLGWVLFRRGKLKEARQEMERAVGLPEGAGDPVVWDHLGDVYFRLGETAQARTSWQKAKSLYENEKRRRLDDQYRELKHKLQLLEPKTQH
jgi:tetratricopeptide (TPR) repeat protein